MKADLYERVTDQIVASLEKGVRPWVKPWSASQPAGQFVLPLRGNGVPYRGINILMLWGAALDHGFTAPNWLTFKQALALGACVRKGEKGSLVVYASSFNRSETDEATGEENERNIPFLKGYTVFNADQVDGLPDSYRTPAPALPAGIERDRTGGSFRGSDRSHDPARRQSGVLQPGGRLRADAAHAGVPRRGELLRHPDPRTDPLDRPRQAACPDLRQTLRRSRLCVRGTGGRTGQRLPVGRPRLDARTPRRSCRLSRAIGSTC